MEAVKLSTFKKFISHDPLSVALYSFAEKVAKFNVPVIISGETGTGKECIARHIHQHAFHQPAPYVAVNCAAIPENMLEAMLFGFEKGAFTGATHRQAGKFELANGGTLLLDEIGDLPYALQAKLLRVLQEKTVERLGSHQSIALQVRLLTATNKDLLEEVNQGRFREDLYYRLAVINLEIPPLRARRLDILPLATLFLQRYSQGLSVLPRFTVEAQRKMFEHAWPGNVRELENRVQRGIVLSSDGTISAALLGLDEKSGVFAADAILSHTVPQRRARRIREHGRAAESQYILDLLSRFQGNKTKTAESLGITTRALRYRLASLRQQGISLEEGLNSGR
ncbi:sigma-54 interaction domain-containing protein [Candidatus Pantoea multigeneris]|uniref:sigma-54 interaction domain-containing protein n=1 Tax=Candidatus Pantoea multigeneris TaxID=2608357 RepID=UPI00351D7942